MFLLLFFVNMAFAQNSPIIYGINNGSPCAYNLLTGACIAAPSLTNPMTTAGDVIYGGASGLPTRLAGGTSGYALTSNGATSAPSWQAITASSAPKWTTARNLAGNSVDGSANVAFANAFVVQGTTDAGLSGAQFLGALGTGIVKNTTSTGVLSIAVAGDFPTLNQNTSGTAADLSATLSIAHGGTNNGSLAVTGGETYYGDGSKIVGLANGTAGQCLQSQGTTVAPQWGSCGGTSPITATSFVAYTPTFAGFGTVTVSSFYSRRVGDVLEVYGTFTSATVSATIATISLGYNGTDSNVTADSTYHSSSLYQNVGQWQRSGGYGQYAMYMVVKPSDGHLYFSFSSSGGNSTPQNSNAMIANTETINIQVSVRISGWTVNN